MRKGAASVASQKTGVFASTKGSAVIKSKTFLEPGVAEWLGDLIESGNLTPDA
jgi:hypothetical protein